MKSKFFKRILLLKLFSLTGLGLYWMTAAKVGGSIVLASCAAITVGCDAQKAVDFASDIGCKVLPEGDSLRFVCADGKEYVWTNQPEESPQCHVSETDSGALIECPDGSIAEVSHGQDGEDGSSCTAYEVEEGVALECEDGSWTLVKHGQDGIDGQDGVDGIDGADGEAAPVSAYAIEEIIDPCGTETSFDEVLLVFANGDILAHYSHGNKQHFSLLSPGNYITTDKTNCRFTVTDEGEVTWQGMQVTESGLNQ